MIQFYLCPEDTFSRWGEPMSNTSRKVQFLFWLDTENIRTVCYYLKAFWIQEEGYKVEVAPAE
jgi:hypothetical protein